MDNPEMDLLLTKCELLFHWNQVSHIWGLSARENGKMLEEQKHFFPADNLEMAQADAIRALRLMRLTHTSHQEDSGALDSLLNKHRLTFNWRNPGLQWWLVGQIKGGNTLGRTQPRPASDVETAKADAVQFILAAYQTTEETPLPLTKTAG